MGCCEATPEGGKSFESRPLKRLSPEEKLRQKIWMQGLKTVVRNVDGSGNRVASKQYILELYNCIGIQLKAIVKDAKD